MARPVSRRVSNSGQPTAFLGLACRAIGQRPGVEIYLDLPALEVPADELLGERVLDVALDGAAQRPRPVRAVLARLLDDPVDHLGRQIEPDLAIDQVVVQLLDQQPRDRPQVVVRERLEDDDFVDAVDELRVERLPHLAQHHVVDAAVDGAGVGGLEPQRRLLLDEAGADVRGHDDDRVLEIDPVAEAVGQMAVLEHLQQDVEQIGMRLLDLVEQHDRVGIPLHLLGELPALFVPDVSRRRANQLRDRVLLHVLGHVEADQRVVAAEQEVGERARQLGLADAGRAEEHEAPHRPVRILQPGAGPPDGARQGARWPSPAR